MKTRVQQIISSALEPMWSRKKGRVVFAGLVAFAVVVYFDVITTEDLNFSIFYLIPIAIYCWYLSRQAAMLMSLASALTWPLIAMASGNAPTFLHLWNGAVSFGFYIIFVGSLRALREHIGQERKINEELSRALSEVRQLSGLLPICASCKKIRNEDGDWNILEKYIQTHTDARFSHTICPECTEKLYPGYLAAKRASSS